MNFLQKLEEDYQESVASGYKRDFKQYCDFLEARNQKPTEVKKSDIGEYILWLRENNIKETTINKKLSLVRKYYKHLRIKKEMVENPFEEIPQLKIYRTEKSINSEQKRKIIESAENGRDRLILEMLIVDQIKPVEMISMKYTDVDYVKQIVILGTKAISLSDNTLSLLKEASKDGNEHILTNQHGKPLKESGIYFVLNKYLKIGDETFKPNDLRKK